MEPEPTDRVERALWQYAYLAHGAGSHPLDWHRFYRFIVMAHSTRKGWDASDISTRLKKYGFAPETAREMAEVYWQCRCALYVRGNFSARTYRAWLKKNGLCVT